MASTGCQCLGFSVPRIILKYRRPTKKAATALSTTASQPNGVVTFRSRSSQNSFTDFNRRLSTSAGLYLPERISKANPSE